MVLVSRGTVSCIDRQFIIKNVVLVSFNNLKSVLCIKYVVIKGNGVEWTNSYFEQWCKHCSSLFCTQMSTVTVEVRCLV